LFLAWTPVARAWSWPLQGPVVQPFAYDEAHPYASGQHRGIDIGAGEAGENVVAPAAGTVSFAGTVPTSGKSLTIDTADGYSVTLTHLGTVLVAKGATIAEGDAVGLVGPSGTPEVDGPYVHLGIRVASDPSGYVDPLSLLPAPAAESPPAESEPTATLPRASGGASQAPPATEPAPVAPSSTPTAVTHGSTVMPPGSRVSPHRHEHAQEPRTETRAHRSSQRAASQPVRSGRRLQHRVRMPQRRPGEPTSSLRRPVVEPEARREPTGLDAGHQIRPTVRVATASPSPEHQTPTVPLQLLCNGVPALVAVAAAYAAALRRRRRRIGASPVAGAEIHQLPRPTLERGHERRAA
jgi:pyruvate/2-oxoglutarate dehydrogenase complex dihydrolipoamide acyltransferase (E2) component